MKKLICTALLIALLCGGLAACGEERDPYPSTATTAEIFAQVMEKAEACSERDGKTYFGNGLIYGSGEGFKPLGEGEQSYFYGTVDSDPDFSCVEQYMLWTATDPVTTEFGIFKVNKMSDVETVMDFMWERVSTLKQNSKDYDAEEYAKADNATIVAYGRYVCYLVTSIDDELSSVIESAIVAKEVKN